MLNHPQCSANDLWFGAIGYRMLRMSDVPEIEVEFLPSTETPRGLAEPGTTPVVPAIANAIFAATGARVRHLPIRPQAVLDECWVVLRLLP